MTAKRDLQATLVPAQVGGTLAHATSASASASVSRTMCLADFSLFIHQYALHVGAYTFRPGQLIEPHLSARRVSQSSHNWKFGLFPLSSAARWLVDH